MQLIWWFKIESIVKTEHNSELNFVSFIGNVINVTETTEQICRQVLYYELTVCYSILIFLFFQFFWDRVSQGSTGCPWTRHVA